MQNLFNGQCTIPRGAFFTFAECQRQAESAFNPASLLYIAAGFVACYIAARYIAARL